MWLCIFIHFKVLAVFNDKLGLNARVSLAALHGLDNVAQHVFVRKLLR